MTLNRAQRGCSGPTPAVPVQSCHEGLCREESCLPMNCVCMYTHLQIQHFRAWDPPIILLGARRKLAISRVVADAHGGPLVSILQHPAVLDVRAVVEGQECCQYALPCMSFPMEHTSDTHWTRRRAPTCSHATTPGCDPPLHG